MLQTPESFSPLLAVRDHPHLESFVFCGDELPSWIRELPAGSVVVTAEAVETPAAIGNRVIEWNGQRAVVSHGRQRFRRTRLGSARVDL